MFKHYKHNNLKHIPNTLTTLRTTYTNVLFGCINEFETKYRKAEAWVWIQNILSIVEGV